jgi:hypothetical protein
MTAAVVDGTRVAIHTHCAYSISMTIRDIFYVGDHQRYTASRDDKLSPLT